MASLERIQELMLSGRYSEALLVLDELSVPKTLRIESDVMRAEVLQRLGRYGQSRAIAEKVIKSPGIEAGLRSSCELTLGQIHLDEGKPREAYAHIQRSLSLATSAKDLRRVVATQLQAFAFLAETFEAQTLGPLLRETRINVTKLGSPTVTANLHIFMGLMEAKRGLLANAVRHTQLGMSLLAKHENIWLEALAENIHVAVAIMRSDIVAGIDRALRALGLAEESGVALIKRASLGNLGNLYYLAGDFDKALDYFQSAQAALPTVGDRTNGTLESLARVHLQRGDFDEALRHIRRLEAAITTPEQRYAYVNRHSQLTCAEITARQGSLNEALAIAQNSLEVADRTNDRHLRYLTTLLSADLLQRAGRFEESMAMRGSLELPLADYTPELHALSERFIAYNLLAHGQPVLAAGHFQRARRIYDGLQNVPGRLDLERGWNEAAQQNVEIGLVTSETLNASARPSHTAGNILQDIAALMLHAGRPELLATDLLAILSASGAVLSAVARAQSATGAIEQLASFGDPAADAPERVFAVGAARGCTFEVALRPNPDIESLAILNAVSLLLATVRDLERAQAEREERLTLWPIDDVPSEDEHAVIAGDMRKLMSSARKIAPTAVTVLITGESGTGKEILARAIHRYSSRADRPFVPFNAAAIPREMLESQLFGHRRGAFTGADRDSLGLIRAAKDGTLFIDEIGELGLDLQPKLLRFLESGEINPLGEPSPFKVDVRIVAATNSNLEQLVQQGRFREDLYYRLNVFPLSIPPLRERRDEIPLLVHTFVNRAAAEFGKGRLRIAEETMEHLLLFSWPGNVRQLNNELRRSVALAEPDSVLTPAALSIQILRATQKAAGRSAAGPELAVPLHDKLMPTLWRIEREMIRVALTSNQGRTEAAARALGISRKGLYLKRQRLGL